MNLKENKTCISVSTPQPTGLVISDKSFPCWTSISSSIEWGRAAVPSVWVFVEITAIVNVKGMAHTPVHILVIGCKYGPAFQAARTQVRRPGGGKAPHEVADDLTWATFGWPLPLITEARE